MQASPSPKFTQIINRCVTATKAHWSYCVMASPQITTVYPEFTITFTFLICICIISRPCRHNSDGHHAPALQLRKLKNLVGGWQPENNLVESDICQNSVAFLQGSRRYGCIALHTSVLGIILKVCRGDRCTQLQDKFMLVATKQTYQLILKCLKGDRYMLWLVYSQAVGHYNQIFKYIHIVEPSRQNCVGILLSSTSEEKFPELLLTPQ